MNKYQKILLIIAASALFISFMTAPKYIKYDGSVMEYNNAYKLHNTRWSEWLKNSTKELENNSFPTSQSPPGSLGEPFRNINDVEIRIIPIIVITALIYFALNGWLQNKIKSYNYGAIARLLSLSRSNNKESVVFQRPLSVTFIGWILLCVGIARPILFIFLLNNPVTWALGLPTLKTLMPAAISSLFLIVSSVLMLYGKNFGRFIFIAYYIIFIIIDIVLKRFFIGELLIFNIAIISILILLFRPQVNAYFYNGTNSN